MECTLTQPLLSRLKRAFCVIAFKDNETVKKSDKLYLDSRDRWVTIGLKVRRLRSATITEIQLMYFFKHEIYYERRAPSRDD